jgi:Zn ribbon nucleic-acid-binding protein
MYGVGGKCPECYRENAFVEVREGEDNGVPWVLVECVRCGYKTTIEG